MGCDLHLVVEQHRADGWKFVPEIDFADRNYDLFAMLADVRNGLAPDAPPDNTIIFRPETYFEPIAEPRGLPDDYDHAANYWFANAEDGGYATSYLCLSELLSYDWTRIVTKHGLKLGSDPKMMEWTATYAELAGFNWWQDLIAPMLKLAHSDGQFKPNDVRVVFCFDN